MYEKFYQARHNNLDGCTVVNIMGNTSHNAIEAIGGLNLPGGGGAAPFQKTLREVKLLSYVNEVGKIIRKLVRNSTEFCK